MIDNFDKGKKNTEMNTSKEKYGLAISVCYFIDRAIYAIEDEPQYNVAISHLDSIYYPLTILEELDNNNAKTIIKAIRGIIGNAKEIIEHENITVSQKNSAYDYLIASSGLATLIAENIRNNNWN